MKVVGARLIKKHSWKRHIDFSSSISRLQFVQVCMEHYLSAANSSHNTATDAAVFTNFPTEPVNTRRTKQFFFTAGDRAGSREFCCTGCGTVRPASHWLSYYHLTASQSPVCDACYQIYERGITS